MSPFTKIPKTDWLASNQLAFAFFDKYPVTPGHTLIVPRRVVPTWFDATPDEQHALMALAEQVKSILDERFEPDGYNIGINAGQAAGQTVMHLHMHVIPRYFGDMPDPRGGVRHVIPWKGNYLKSPTPALSTGGPDDPFVAHLLPLFAGARRIAIVAAFVQDSGLELLRDTLLSTLERGVDVRLLTGDYFNITQAHALQRLLDWMDASAAVEGETGSAGSLDVRIVEVGKRAGWPRSFHPKSWRFDADDDGVAFVGSSNISRTALTVGAEWNLRVRRQDDPEAYDEITRAFDAQWNEATPLSAEWVRSYALRAKYAATPLPPGEEEPEPPAAPPTPHKMQAEALQALAEARRNGRRRALIVHATGLGKTWLAAFDVQAFARYFHVTPRVLVLAHRAEILQQAAETFRKILPDAAFGWFVGARSRTVGEVIFASVQKLTREDHLQKFAPDAFDYIIVDEVHHAAAPSYRRILNHFDPGFLLGLTATPDRADEADIRPFFDDFVAHRVDIGEGINLGILSPFHYHGLKDSTDYAPIPWRSGKFQTAELTRALATQQRMERAWEALEEHPGDSTLIFCASIDHARFVARWLGERCLRVAAVYSRPDSADRDASLRALKSGELDAVCAVDILNEGVDIPRVDRVLMLRPTESPVVFMQQLGRGLRRTDAKEYLTVIDFVGNHRVFLDRVRTLLSLGPGLASLRGFLVDGDEPELPAGCKIDVEFEAIDLLQSLLPQPSSNALVREYRELRDARGRRPTAGEIHRLGLNLRTLKKYGGWFGFLADEGDLTDDERVARQAGEAWFWELETTALNKSYKMVVLQALLDHDALGRGMPIAQLADASHRILSRAPELFRDIATIKKLPNPRNPDPETWRKYWDEWPLKIWAGDKNRKLENPWFSRPDGHAGDFVSYIPVPGEPNARDAFLAMTRELVEYRIAQYRDRYDAAAQHTGAFRAKLISNKRDPILKLPSRKTHPDMPTGETTVTLPDGQNWRFRFVKIAVNVARPVGDDKNRLPDLLRGWFGPDAGEPGTRFEVEFRPAKDGWRVEPLGENVIPFARPGHIIAFPTLQAAAGAYRLPQTDAPGWTQLNIRHAEAPPSDFAVRAHGHSMDAGDQPIRDGDWVLMRWARGETLGSVLNRVALVRHKSDDHPTPAYFLKRITQTPRGIFLTSDNPQVSEIPASNDTTVIALHTHTLKPRNLDEAAIDAFISALQAELEAHAPEPPSAYGQAFSQAIRGIFRGHEYGDALLSDLSTWLSAAYGMDIDAAGAMVERVIGE